MQLEHTPAGKQFRILLLAIWLCSSVFLSFGLTRPVIGIAVNPEGVFRDALEQQPIIGLYLQYRGLKIADIASKLPRSSPMEQSIVSSDAKLFHLKRYAAGTLILLFSIVVPIAKQIAFLMVALLPHGSSGKLRSLLPAIHKWAMLDVFVLSTVVVALSSSTSTAWNAVLLDGFYWFLGYFFTAGVLGLLLSRRAKSVRAPRGEDHTAFVGV